MPGAESAQRGPSAWVASLTLLVLAGALRLRGLGGQLWLDEISALRGYRKPFLETLTTFPVFFPNPLYELAAHASLLVFGESAFAIRLPAALFGVGGVLVFHRLARRCLGPGQGFLAAALLAVSYHHVFYSQDARGYAAWLFFALLATDLLLGLLERMERPRALAYVGAAALGAYAHPFGVFVPVGHLALALPVVWRRRGASLGPSPKELFVTGVGAGLAIALLYAPLLRDAVAYVGNEAQAASHGPRVLGLLPELLEGLRAGLGGWMGLALGAAVGLIGAADLLRRQPMAPLLLAAPIAFSAAAMLILGAGVHPRYFLLALPLGVLIATRGLTLSATPLLARLPGYAGGALLQRGLAVALVVIAATPLLHYYAVPKQDYLGALAHARAAAAPGDVIVAADLAGRAIHAWYDPELPVVENLADLERVETTGRSVWVLTTLERPMAGRTPDLLDHLHRHYQRHATLPGTVGDGALRVYLRHADDAPR